MRIARLNRISFGMILTLFFFSCTNQTDSRSSNPGGNQTSPRFQTSRQPVQNFHPAADKDFPAYFPTNIGSTWTYKIQIGEVEPIFYKQIRWQTSLGETITTAARGRFAGVETDPAKKEFVLKIKLEETSKAQCELEYPLGYRLKVIRDELGVYKYTKYLFWAIKTRDGFQVIEVNDIVPDQKLISFGTDSSRSVVQGCALNLKIFAKEPGVSADISANFVDNLLYMGFTQIPGTNQQGLHYVREVKANSQNEMFKSSLDSGFTEDIYFLENIGLAYLQQKINGQVSMTWTLIAEPAMTQNPK
ncbi:MAG: hypothetical protein NTX82_04880 [Candidatus Parcubacteria bacterium]|nr:hypothetical protein [Candidatus Parcubacteria bacterium]